MKIFVSLLLFFASSLLFSANPAPQLIVQLVVDQLRGDLLHQYQLEFGADGFNYLLNHGIDFQNAHHPQAYTVTCVGHAIIATGSYPFLNGIVANDWFDRDTKQLIYCVEDLKSTILTTPRMKKALPGRSPKNILSSTLADEIVLAKKGRAFSVSLKDRAAVTLGGHAGKAFWFDRENGGFITSSHYYKRYPKWVTDWNAAYQPKEETWALSQDKKNYRFAQAVGFKPSFTSFGEGFPHLSGKPDDPLYFKLLSMMPKADELTADFALSLLKHEKLGKTPNQTDYLAISFSAVDVIGHQFGPNSIESEDNLLHLDKTIANVLKTIDEEVGLENTLIVLTADHGMTDALPYLQENHFDEAPAVDTSKLRNLILQRLDKFGLGPEALQAIHLPYIYLNHSVIAAKPLEISQVSKGLIQTIMTVPGVFQVYSLPVSSPPNWLSRKVAKMAFPYRAGDLYVVPPPYQGPLEKIIHADHGTPWRYDSYVPLLFANPKFTARHVSRSVKTTDIAATLAAIIQTKEPSASVGQPLQEVLRFYEQDPS